MGNGEGGALSVLDTVSEGGSSAELPVDGAGYNLSLMGKGISNLYDIQVGQHELRKRKTVYTPYQNVEP